MEALNSQRRKCLSDVTQLLPIHQLKLKVGEGEATAPGSCAGSSDGASLPAGFTPATRASLEAKLRAECISRARTEAALTPRCCFCLPSAR